MGRLVDNFINAMLLCLYKLFTPINSQTVHLSVTATLVAFFVSASRCSCSLMCLALSQHHAALALSCALLCLSITLLLLSHVSLALSQHHAALALTCLVLLMCLALSQHHHALALVCFALSQHAIPITLL